MVKSILSLCVSMIFSMAVTGQSFYNTWYGTLDIQGTKIRLVFHVSDNNGSPATTLDSPDQGAKGLPTSSTVINGDSIFIKAEYGTISPSSFLTYNFSKSVG